jgi:hypothetical protein
LSGAKQNNESNLTGAVSAKKTSEPPSALKSNHPESATVSESEKSEDTKEKLRQHQEANIVNLQLKESIKLNNKKVAGASSIRSLIRSAATRD